MYVPDYFRMDDIPIIKEFIRNHDLATVVSRSIDRPLAAHLMVELDDSEEGLFKLRGHMSKENPIWESFDDTSDILAISQGAHTYISPTWYEKPAPPTWNSMSVHVYGKPAILTDRNDLRGVLDRLVTRHEVYVVKWFRTQSVVF